MRRWSRIGSLRAASRRLPAARFTPPGRSGLCIAGGGPTGDGGACSARLTSRPGTPRALRRLSLEPLLRSPLTGPASRLPPATTALHSDYAAPTPRPTHDAHLPARALPAPLGWNPIVTIVFKTEEVVWFAVQEDASSHPSGAGRSSSAASLVLLSHRAGGSACWPTTPAAAAAPPGTGISSAGLREELQRLRAGWDAAGVPGGGRREGAGGRRGGASGEAGAGAAPARQPGAGGGGRAGARPAQGPGPGGGGPTGGGGGGGAAGRLPVYGNPNAMSKIFNPDIAVIGNFLGAAGRTTSIRRAALQLDEAEASVPGRRRSLCARRLLPRVRPRAWRSRKGSSRSRRCPAACC